MEFPGTWVIIGILILTGALVGVLVLAACTVADKFYGGDLKKMIMCEGCGEHKGGVNNVEEAEPPQPSSLKVVAGTNYNTCTERPTSSVSGLY